MRPSLLQLNGLAEQARKWGALIAIIAFGSTLVAMVRAMPEQVQDNEVAIEVLRDFFNDTATTEIYTHGSLILLNAKMDRVLCLLTLPEGTDPLTCERQGSGANGEP
jgi:hypothetical protein